MLPTVACIHRGLFCSCAGLSVRMTSRGIGQKGILANRVAVVTGSTDGIGFAIARRLARDGAHVVVSSRKQQNVDWAVAALQGEGLSVVGTVCHVGKAEDRERLVATVVEHCGGLDFLVCSAGVNPLVGSTLGASEQVWDKVRGCWGEAAKPESEIIDMCSVLLLSRIGQPEDCAGLVSFLCSPDASYITGENIVVAGFSSRL
ncbi:dehydrogenase/reductase SDR family member 2, mitochondrial isoform X3 [Prionailurus viverrinus]|uniref:dehydrogenase/reductase SDR family member 2, mitochondrial isoform X3 n=1 Tax=Prionailurus viverrinus TaxID=61388 RepID=UPI001FF685B9|nr:dehydrogenase/reductase SDR family member 2, mitochondrial isoform X3 [Prionailurus viverrinus]